MSSHIYENIFYTNSINTNTLENRTNNVGDINLINNVLNICNPKDNKNNIKQPNNTKIIATKSKWKFCLIQILIFFILFIFFLINYFETIDNFKDNRILTMNPANICSKYIEEHNDCLNKYRNASAPNEIIEECVAISMRLQYCYDQIKNFNRKCYLYLSEFEKCVRNNFKINEELSYLRNKCKDEVENIKICTSQYIVIDPFELIDYNYK